MSTDVPMISSIPIFDGHNDTLLALHLAKSNNSPRYSFFESNEQGHIVLPRARAGGMGGGFFAIFTPSDNHQAAPMPGVGSGQAAGYAIPTAPEVEQARALQFTVDLAADLFRLEREGQGLLKVVRTAA